MKTSKSILQNRNGRNLASLALALSLSVLVIGALPMAAIAQTSGDPTKAQYDNSIDQIQDGFGSTPSSGSSSGLQQELISGLPFTGLDLIALFAVAVALVGMGFALRHLTAERE